MYILVAVIDCEYTELIVAYRSADKANRVCEQANKYQQTLREETWQCEEWKDRLAEWSNNHPLTLEGLRVDDRFDWHVYHGFDVRVVPVEGERA